MGEAACYHATRFRPDPRRDRTWARLAAYLSRYVPPDARILDLGAGYCHFVNNVRGRRRVAVDSSTVVLPSAADGVEAVQADAVDYLDRAPAAQFDFVFASNFLEHLDRAALDRLGPLLYRCLAPRGRLALIQPNFRLAPGKYFDDYTHRTIFTDASLRDWVESHGFEVQLVVPRFLPLTVKSGLGYFSFLLPFYLRLPWRPLAGQMFVVAERPGGAADESGSVQSAAGA